MAGAIGVLNAGSSSIKFSLFLTSNSELELAVRGQIEGIYTAPHFVAKRNDGTIAAEKSWPEGTKLGHDGALDHLVAFLRSEFAGAPLVGVGHRVVHGGLNYAQPVVIDAGTVAALEKLVPLAPLHQPHNLAPIRWLLGPPPRIAAGRLFRHLVPPHESRTRAAIRAARGVARGRSAALRLPRPVLRVHRIGAAAVRREGGVGRTIVLHLGNGASMCAIEAGRSIASTMGFTALDGLPMGTRSGSLDPGVILYLMDNRGLDARAIEKLLYNQSGLLGVSGISNDMRTLLASNDPPAKLAVDLYCYRIRRELGSLAAALGGLDAIVFTGGIGENSAAIRERVCRDAAWLGVELDPAANAAGGPRISTLGARVSAWTIPTNEELMIARHTRSLL